MMEEDIVIAVMGQTGAGKSRFIKSITGREDIVVGEGLESGRLIQPWFSSLYFC